MASDSLRAIDIQQATVFLEQQRVLHDLTLGIERDEHLAILGPNGCGKSTLIKLISGDVYPLHRKEPAPIRVFGETSWDLFELRSKLGIVSPSLQACCRGSLTGLEVILSGFFGSLGTFSHQAISPSMEARARETSRFLGIAHLDERPLSRMSSGEARRFLIGRALVHDPGMLVLDEPFASLDLKAHKLFAATLRRIAAQGHSIVLVTHSLEEILPEIERVVLIKNGTVLADGAKEALLRSDRISDLFELPIEVVREVEGYRARFAA